MASILPRNIRRSWVFKGFQAEWKRTFQFLYQILVFNFQVSNLNELLHFENYFTSLLKLPNLKYIKTSDERINE